MSLNPTQPLLVPNSASGELDYDSAWFCRALFKSISLMFCPGSLGCGSDTNATKDSVDALMCVSYPELCEWKTNRALL